MKKIKGDLITMALNGDFDIIAHGCNCFCTMGAGIAKQIKTVFPEAWEVDKITPRGNIKKFGEFTWTEVNVKNGKAVPLGEGKSLIVANLYTQFTIGIVGEEKITKGGVVISESQKERYAAIGYSLSKLKQQFPNKSIGLPYIGAGLAGGDWGIISKILEEVYPEATVIEFQPKKWVARNPIYSAPKC